MLSSERHVLVIAPHPDDESLGCGGTIKLLTEANSTVDICFLTRGELGTEVPVPYATPDALELGQIRTDEAYAAAQILGASQTVFLGGTDGQLSDQPQLGQQLAELLNIRGYSRVFAPWAHDRHPDHKAAFLMLQKALRAAPAVSSVWMYEVWTPLSPNNYVPIDGTIAAKRSAIEAHRSQLKCLNYLDSFLGLAAYRALSCPPSKYAEAFFVADRETTLQIR